MPSLETFRRHMFLLCKLLCGVCTGVGAAIFIWFGCIMHFAPYAAGWFVWPGINKLLKLSTLSSLHRICVSLIQSSRLKLAFCISNNNSGYM